MARHPAMAAASPEEPDPHTPAVQVEPAVKGGRLVLPAFVPAIDPQRYARLSSIDVLRGVNKAYAGPAIEAGKRLWCLTDEATTYTDRDAVRAVARFLVIDADRMGAFNFKASFRRANVDAYLNYLQTYRRARGMRTIRGQLYAVGRTVHPREYPARQALAQPHVRRTPAASPKLVDELYALAPTLPASLSQRLFVVLDCCLGAGARAGDFRTLTGQSVTEARWEGETVAVVNLPNIAGGHRHVPVADVEVSQRLLALARTRKSEFLLRSTNGEVERNATNRVAEHLRNRGYPGFDASALRNRWLIEMATRVPAALMLQLADVTTAQILSDQRDQLPNFGLQHAIALTKENNL